MKIGKIKNDLAEFLKTGEPVRWLLLFSLMTVFTVILYPHIIFTKHTWQQGDVADRDIKAPADFLIEDKAATEKKRKESAESVLTVYDHNAELVSKITLDVENAFHMMQDILREEEDRIRESAETFSSDSDEAENGRKSLNERIWEKKEEFEKQIGIVFSTGAFRILETAEFSSSVSDLILKILKEILENGVVANKELLMRESERGIVLRTVGSQEERIVTNLKKFYGLDQAKTMVRIVGQPILREQNYTLVNLIVDVTQQLLQPNITFNLNETEQRKTKAAESVQPIFYKIKAGEMLLREGERVTDLQLLKLEALRRQHRQESRFARVIGNLAIVMSLLIITVFLHTRQPGRRRLRTNRELLFLSVMLALYFLFPGISLTVFDSLARSTPFDLSENSRFFGIPLASGAMTVCLFMGFGVAITYSMVLSFCVAVIFQSRFEVFVYFFLTCLMAAYWMQSCRERKVFIRAGFKIGILNMGLSAALSLYMGDFSGTGIFWIWSAAFMSGIISGVITAGVVPLMEMIFGYITDITLLELANLEQPILRRLMMEAPGTYHHCVVVGSMVEAAAAEIGANPLLAKVCGYYHDIGKIRKPLYFVENQKDGKNRHDKLAPSMSGLILISHVKDGVDMAVKNKLGPDIADAIRQHHGTSLIKYFYEKAKQLKGEDAVNIADYRYPGPKPQTREIALVMLADVVEAASRTLENPTPSRIQGLVRNLITNVFTDGQLDDCELTLRDLDNISKTFNKILNGIHHHRIEYPEQRAGTDGKEKNGSTDHRQSKSVTGEDRGGSGSTGKDKADRADSPARSGIA
ncbi:MAG: HDIG domain-containing protein [Desulfobacterales bacterium]